MGDADQSALDSRVLSQIIERTRPLLARVRLEDALELTATKALELCSAERSWVRILDLTGTKILLGARAGKHADQDPISREPNETLLPWVVEQRKAIRISDAREDRRTKDAANEDEDLRSILEIPLIAGDQVHGTLRLSSSNIEGFSETEALSLELFVSCAGPVIAGQRRERLSVTDLMTLAYNGRYLMPRLKEELSRSVRHGHPLSLLVMDLDEFSRINEVHGRAAGDIVLQRFADRVRRTSRLSDILIRRSGEEFVLIATDTSLEAATTYAERLRAAIEDPPILQDTHGTSILQTVSIGVACWNGRESATELVERANVAQLGASEKGNSVTIAE